MSAAADWSGLLGRLFAVKGDDVQHLKASKAIRKACKAAAKAGGSTASLEGLEADLRAFLSR